MTKVGRRRALETIALHVWPPRALPRMTRDQLLERIGEVVERYEAEHDNHAIDVAVFFPAQRAWRWNGERFQQFSRRAKGEEASG